MNSNNQHQWKFYRAGGFDQLLLRDGADLMHLEQLDQKLWVALACPARGLEFDQRTLDLVDTDKDGRIRAPEIIAAAKWACEHLKNPDVLLESSPQLPLSAINDATPEGKLILSSARQILAGLGKKDATAIGVEDTSDTVKIFSQTRFNGDGIVPADVAEDANLKAIIDDIIACLGAETDRSGKPGVNRAKVEAFFAAAQAYADWHKKSGDDATILPLGATTTAAAAAVEAIKVKVEDYFSRCRLAAFDARAAALLNREEKEYLAIAAKDLSIAASEIAGFPLARIEADRPLPCVTGVNPAWIGAMQRLVNDAVKPLLGERATLTEADWTALTAKLAPFHAWQAGKAGAAVETLGIQRVRDILAANAMQPILSLITQDQALEPEATAIAAVDKLARYQRDLVTLLHNFVSFGAFYGQKEPAIFQVGTLYLDQRSCTLCIRVEDMGRHASLATLSRVYLAYCDCVRQATGEKMTIAAAITGGDSDNLMVGRNGIFYDRQGHDWDATIVKIVDNPISLRQAFWSPYKKFVRLVEEQIEKFAAGKDKAIHDKAAMGVANAATVAEADTPPPKKEAFDVARFAGIFAAIGLAIGAIGGAVGAMISAFSTLAWWQMPLAILGIMILISGPALVIAALKLRQRNLGPILDANGWAVNTRARINIPFGGTLTQIAELPTGAQRELTDPYAEDHTTRNRMIVLIVLGVALWLAWYFGCMNMGWCPVGGLAK